MSPLSIKRRFARALGVDSSLRLYIGRDVITAAYIVSNPSDEQRVVWLREHRFAEKLFNGLPTATAATDIANGIAAICADLKPGFLPVQVALPDPIGSYTVFELDEIPKGPQALRDLVRWRLANEHHHDESAIECRCQPMGREGDKALVLAVAIERAWLNCAVLACARAGLMVTAADLALAYRFNDLYQRLTADKSDGALVTLDAESWSVALWDREARIRFVRSRWRRASAHDHEAIATEVTRSLSAYLRPHSGRTIQRIYLTGERVDADAIATLLPRFVTQPSVYLAADVDLHPSVQAQPQTASTAVEATVARAT